jgi:hypothetical protein
METKRPETIEIKSDYGEFEAVLPPEIVSTVCRTISRGPNLQVIEHCHFADTVEHLRDRAPLFHVRIPTCTKGKNRDWPTGDVGEHHNIQLPVAIVESKRVNDSLFEFVGHIRTTESNKSYLYVDVLISNYSIANREGKISMSRDVYVRIIELWRDGLFKTF